jgi:hypothetical protein
VLSRELIRSERIALTLAINGYDDGLSTGEVRRFLGDSLGPSDFRKNASRLATELRTCDERLVKLLDLRFPDGYGFEEAKVAFALLREGGPHAADDPNQPGTLMAVDRRTAGLLADRLDRFERNGPAPAIASASPTAARQSGSPAAGVGRDFNRARGLHGSMGFPPA